MGPGVTRSVRPGRIVSRRRGLAAHCWYLSCEVLNNHEIGWLVFAAARKWLFFFLVKAEILINHTSWGFPKTAKY